MSNIPENLSYTKDHEWILFESDQICKVGITDHAQDALGDVTFVDIPQVGTQFSQGDVFGVVESVKAASDLYMPVNGEVIGVNAGLNDSPELVNTNPYENGWIIKVQTSDSRESSGLLNHSEYEEEIG